MSARIIDAFEMIEIRENHSERTALPHLTRVFASYCFKGRGSIRNAGERVMGCAEAQLFPRSDQAVLQIEDALAHAQSRAPFLCVEGFRQVVVRAGSHATKQVPLLPARREQENVDVRSLRVLTHALADLRTFQAGHHPV